MTTMEIIAWGVALGLLAVTLSYFWAALQIGLMVIRVKHAGYPVERLTLREINQTDHKLRSAQR